MNMSKQTQCIQDAPIRKQALNPAKSFIVQAPAGSGKTELLTQRYLILLSQAQKAPEEIIAITFTKKAAAEMRARVIQALLFAQSPEPNPTDYRHTIWQLGNQVLKKDAQNQWDILHNPNRLRILTIDALSYFICSKTPMLTQFGGSFAICDDPSRLYQEAVQRIFALQPDAIAHLLLHLDNDAHLLSELLCDLLSNRDQWLPTIIHCMQHHSTLQNHLNQSLDRIRLEKLLRAYAAIPASYKQTISMLAHHAARLCSELKIETPIAFCSTLDLTRQPILADYPAWIGLTTLLLTKEQQWRKRIDKNSGFLPGTAEKKQMEEMITALQSELHFQHCLADIAMLPHEPYSTTQWETISALTTILPLLAAQLLTVFHEKGQIDFVESNLAALNALGTDEEPTDLALYLDYQIQHLLIDEFQDTSITHLHLIEKITTGWQNGDGRTLFVVGDPMQSIYRFRNAEVGLFLRAQQHGIGQIQLESLTLTMNFRSQSNLIHWINETFTQLFPAVIDIAAGCVPYTPAIAARPAVENENVHFNPIFSDGNDDEAIAVVNQIDAIQKRNQLESIAILVRSRAQLIPIIRELKAKNKSFQAIQIEPLMNRPVIQDLLSLTRALLHRADRIAWFAILRAPFCGLTLSDMEIIAKENCIWESMHSTIIESLSDDGQKRILFLMRCLENAFAIQYHLPIAQWVQQCWLSLQGPALLSSSHELEDVDTFFQLLEKIESEHTILSVETLLQQCEKLFANADHSENNPIQIMTIHKSKGLEFDHVFLPGLQRSIRGDSRELFQWMNRLNAFGTEDLVLAPIRAASEKEDVIYRFVQQSHEEKNNFETTRLLYVAATRAKKSLHLYATLKNDAEQFKPVVGSFLEKLWPLYQNKTHFISTNLAPSLPPTQSSAILTRLQSIPTYSDDSENMHKNRVKIDIRPRSHLAQAVGTVIHQQLQLLADSNIIHPPSDAYLFQLGLLPHECSVAKNSIETAIKRIKHDPRAQWILSSQHCHARSEWAVSYCIDSIVHHHVIDRTFVDEHNTRWIIDYKTSTPNDNETLSDFLLREKESYQDQLARYAHIVAAMEDRPVRAGLYFPLCDHGWIEWQLDMLVLQE